MRNISFALTTEQIRKRTKTVTRRVGWNNLKAGDLLQGVLKCQGLKKGEKITPLCQIRVKDVRKEPLNAMNEDLDYGYWECEREGFGGNPALMLPSEFVSFFCATHKCTPETVVTRIEFEYVEDVK